MSRSRSAGKRSSSGPLLARPPKVYLGPGASRALAGNWGLLSGMRRPRWIDVLAIEPCARPRPAEVPALRFGPPGAWPIVGLSLPESDWRRRAARLLRDLVPGDVVMTEEGARVHLGNAWAKAPLLRDAFRAR